jgi:hypothetical protein
MSVPTGRFTGTSYTPMSKPTMLRPVQDITQFATGFPEQRPVSPRVQARPPSQIDPAFDAFMRGEDLRGARPTGLLDPVDNLEPVDDSNYRAIQIDMGLPLFDR